MDYVILKNEETGEVEKLGRFRENGIAEQFAADGWESDASLYSLQFDGLLENVSEVEAAKIIARRRQREKIAA